MPEEHVFGIEQSNLNDRPSYDALRLWRYLKDGRPLAMPVTKVECNFAIKSLMETDNGKLRLKMWKLKIKRRQLASLPRLILMLEAEIIRLGGDPSNA
jgi:hypothetical protein